MATRGNEYQALLNRSTDEIKAQAKNLMKICENGKEKEKLEALRQLYFLGTFFLSYIVIDEISPFEVDEKLARLLSLDLGARPLSSDQKIPKRDLNHSPRMLSLLVTCGCRFLSLEQNISMGLQNPSILKLLQRANQEKNKIPLLKSYTTHLHLDRLLLWQREDQKTITESTGGINTLISTLQENTQLASTLLPSILFEVKQSGPERKKFEKTVRATEEMMKFFLLSASTLSEYDPDKKRLFSKAPTKVLELDGTPSKEFFTVLCFPTNGYFNATQNANIFTFSFIMNWLRDLYLNPDTYVISEDLVDAIIKYCFRIIEQSKLVPATDNKITGKGIFQHSQPAEFALPQAVRLLDILCDIKSECIESVEPAMQKLIDLPISRTNANFFLSLLCFFTKHSDPVTYDLTHQFDIFFLQILPSNITNSILSLEVLHFCNLYKERLLTTTRILQSYFPPLLKLFCWSPMSNASEMVELLPGLLSPENFVEVFHSLVDLPLTTCAMEKIEEFGAEEVASERALCNYLLRNESGVTINFWASSTTMPLLQEFCKTSVVTPRARAVSSLVPLLLERFFDVVIDHTEKEELSAFLPAIVERLDQLYPLPSFQVRVKKILVDKFLGIFHTHPELLCSHSKELVLQTLTDASTPGRSELILSLVWLIGEYANPQIVENCSVNDVKEFHERLRFFAYERTSLVKNGITNIAFLSRTPLPSYAPVDPLFLETLPEKNDPTKAQEAESCKQYTSRLMVVVISAVVKLAIHCTELYDHSSICLQKIWQHSEYFDEIVIQHAKDFLSLLQFPAVLSSIFQQTPATPLPFMFLPDTSNEETSVETFGEQKLHLFHG